MNEYDKLGEKFEHIVQVISRNQYLDENIDLEIRTLYMNAFDRIRVPVQKSSDVHLEKQKLDSVPLNTTLRSLKEVLKCTQILRDLCLEYNLKSVTKSTSDAINLCCVGLGAMYLDRSSFWSSDDISNIAKDLLNLIIGVDKDSPTALEIFDAKREIENQTEENVKYRFGGLKCILNHFAKTLTKENWKKDPGSQKLYGWIIQEIPVSIYR